MSWLSRFLGKSAVHDADSAGEGIPTIREEAAPGTERPVPSVTATWPSGGRPDWMRDGMTVRLYEGDLDLEVVGEASHQPELRALAGVSSGRVRVPHHAILVPESGNPYDDNAVGVWIGGLLVGYLAREDASALRPGILTLVTGTGKAVALEAVIVGGGPRGDGREGLLGVWMRYNPVDFGMPASGPTLPVAVPAGFRTGLSEAISTDEADNSYDLGWLNTLPDTAAERLPLLRELLQTENEPLSRHYVMRALEADLYTLRSINADALEQYDRTTVLHDGEMDTIRPALMTRFGRMPLLETYRQATIRHSKAGQPDRALWWARRGLEMYRDDAHNPAWVADLDKRAAILEGKIERQTRPSIPRPKASAPATPWAEESATESLVCRTCGREFTRARTRGRKPHQCPDCRPS